MAPERVNGDVDAARREPSEALAEVPTNRRKFGVAPSQTRRGDDLVHHAECRSGSVRELRRFFARRCGCRTRWLDLPERRLLRNLSHTRGPVLEQVIPPRMPMEANK
jgi:hypothetical protein